MAIRKVSEFNLKPNKFFDLQDRVAFIVGGASGLGQAQALTFDALGAKVVLADINEAGMEETAAELKNDHFMVKLDVTSPDSVIAAVKKAHAHFGKIDISCNNAGVNIRKEAFDLSYEEFDKVLEINIKGVYRCAREVGKIMVDQKRGSMINMSSTFAEICQIRQVAYCSSKGAVRMMTKVLAAEWAPHNVRVNAIAPAYVETPFVKQIMEDKAWYQGIIAHYPIKRFAYPEEVAAAAVYLASDASSFTTGLYLPVDGGSIWYGGDL